MWQPIETAPKDKQVLLYCPKRGVVRGWWNDCRHYHKPRPYWTHDRERMYGVIETRDDQPTHWMPLPDGPGAQVQPALSVPDEDAAYNDWFHGEQGVAYDGMWSFAKAAWMARAALAAPETKPALSIMDAIIDDLQSQFDSEGITEYDSGDALIRLSDAIAAVEDNFAQPATSVSVGWLRAIDEALAVTHLGVANAGDSYEDAKRKLYELIGWHTDVATDPAVNGGFKLVPIEPTEEMLEAMFTGSLCFYSDEQRAAYQYQAMLAAAPEAKP